MYRVYKAESISVQVIFTDFGPNAGSTYRLRALWYGSGFKAWAKGFNALGLSSFPYRPPNNPVQVISIDFGPQRSVLNRLRVVKSMNKP